MANDSVTSVKITDGTVTSADIANGTIATADIAAGAIGTGSIANGAVTGGKIADGTVSSADIQDGTIATADIAAGAIGSARIAEGAVISGKIVNGAVTSAHIANGTITQTDVDTSSIQRRVTGSCSGGQVIASVQENGTVTCVAPGGSSVVRTQVNTGSIGTSSMTPTRYIVRATPARVGRVVPFDLGLMRQLCRDDDGCEVSLAMVNGSTSQPGNVASRGERLYLSETSKWWRFENNDLSGLDGSGVNEWTPWDCFVTDAETSTNTSNGRSDSGAGWGLLNVHGGSYSDPTTTCRVTFID